MRPNVDPEFKSLIPPLSTEERQQLEANVKAGGCRDALIVWNGILLDGHNRLEICEQNNIPYKTYEVRLADRRAAKVWIIKNQFGRRNLQPYVRGELGLTLKDILAEEARERQDEGRRIGGQTAGKGRTKKDDSFPQNSGESKPKQRERETSRQIAKLSGLSHDTISRIETIKAKATPEDKAALKAGDKSINEVYKKIRNEERIQQKQALAEEIKAEPVPAPVGPFRVIAIDPPWKYGNRAEDASHRGRNQYPDMSVDEICALPVADLAHDDSVLWLWTTNAFMREAYQCLDAWGFKDKTILTWDKQLLGLGDYLRNVTEHCILATRGKPTILLTNQTTLISEKRREHSRKPDAFYELVEALCPGSKLEMFARAPRDGWQVWGAETEHFANVS